MKQKKWKKWSLVIQNNERIDYSRDRKILLYRITCQMFFSPVVTKLFQWKTEEVFILFKAAKFHSCNIV